MTATLICVVEEPGDVIPIERTHEYRGRYHVLGGALSPIDGVEPEDLRLVQLYGSVSTPKLREVILATNPTTTGEATRLHIAAALHERAPDVAVTRLASGLPVGGDLEYADEVTLGRAFSGRRARVSRARVLRLARRLGLEPPLRRVQDAVMPAAELRNRRDDAHLRAVMAALLRPDANVIDVGANAGDVLAEAVRLAPRGRHIAFEPLPDLAARLRERFPGVEVRAAALSNRAGEATFQRRLDADSRSGLLALGGPSEPLTVPLERLDDVLEESYVPDLIKIDVEGAELAVLEGALGTLTRHRPVVAFEHGSAALAYGTTHGMVHELLCGDAGLRIFDMDGGGPYDRAAFEAVADPPGGRWNFLARP